MMKFKVQSSKFKVKSLKFKAAVVLLFVFWGLFGLNSVQAVGLIIKPTEIKISEPGRYQTNISVIARPLGAGGLTLASGVKLPLMIEVSGWPLWAYFAGVILLIIICLLIGFGVKWILSKGKQDKFSAR